MTQYQYVPQNLIFAAIRTTLPTICFILHQLSALQFSSLSPPPLPTPPLSASFCRRLLFYSPAPHLFLSQESWVTLSVYNSQSCVFFHFREGPGKSRGLHYRATAVGDSQPTGLQLDWPSEIVPHKKNCLETERATMDQKLRTKSSRRGASTSAGTQPPFLFSGVFMNNNFPKNDTAGLLFLWMHTNN